jgi:hypothetical protein
MNGAIKQRLRGASMALLVACAALFPWARMAAEPVPTRHTEGLVHGFLVLRTLDGETIANGDLSQVVHGDRVTNRLIFRFNDGSVQEETAVFSQRSNFRLLTDHLVQRGPAFEHSLDVSINAPTGEITVHSSDEKGKQKAVTEHLTLPPDLANGLVFTLLKNIRPEAPQTKVSMLAATPKPRLVKLAITSQGEEPFSVGGSGRKATHFVVKIELGGAAGIVAPIIGKQTPDIHVWILEGEAPAFVKSEGPFFFGGPVWRIELASPVWPRLPAGDSKD